MRNLSPIILTVYNRPEHTKKTLEALKANTLASKSTLYIYADGSKNEETKKDVEAVRKYIRSVKEGFKEIHIVEREKNFGLANNIINAVTEVINIYGKIILIEDDLVSSPVFLEYMNNMLDKYEKEEKVFSITGFGYPKKLMKIPPDYKYDIYFLPRTASWGWATWKNRWDKADWEMKDYKEFLKKRKLQREFGYEKTEMLIKQMNNKIDSWAIRWDYTHFKYNGYCIFPIRSYIDNIGLDGSGIHSGNDKTFSQKEDLSMISSVKTPEDFIVDDRLVKNFNKMFKGGFFKMNLYILFRNTPIYTFYKEYKGK